MGGRSHALPGAALSAATIRQLIEADPPLLSGLRDLERQLQPNGVDLTLEALWRIVGRGALGVEDVERVLPERQPVEPGPDDYFELRPGPYIGRLNETVHLPPNVMGLGKPRSSLLRSGVAVHNAVWDAGYRGRSEVLVVVYHPDGFRLRRHARIVQLVFFGLDQLTDPYRGRYQGENLDIRETRS